MSSDRGIKPGPRRARGLLAAAALAVGSVGVLASVAMGAVVPEAPALPSPPPEAEPALGVLTPAWEATGGGVCGALGAALSLAGVLGPTIEPAVYGVSPVPLPSVPGVGVTEEVLAALQLSFRVQSYSCSLFPLQEERTMCAADEEVAAAVEGLPDDVPSDAVVTSVDSLTPAPVGMGLDTIRATERPLGSPTDAPGHAETELGCETHDAWGTAGPGLDGDAPGGPTSGTGAPDALTAPDVPLAAPPGADGDPTVPGSGPASGARPDGQLRSSPLAAAATSGADDQSASSAGAAPGAGVPDGHDDLALVGDAAAATTGDISAWGWIAVVAALSLLAASFLAPSEAIAAHREGPA